MPGPINVRPGDLSDPAVKDLLRFHLEQVHASSPPGSVFALDWSGLAAPGVSFWTIHAGEDLIGCGAMKQLDPAHGEIKSMRTAPAHLRRGAGAAMLAHIVSEARARGYTRLSLENRLRARVRACFGIVPVAWLRDGRRLCRL